METAVQCSGGDIMPEIGGGGKTFAVGFWDSENCDNSLASFPDGTDFSWGVLSLEVDGCDSDNFVEVQLLNATNGVLHNQKYTTNGLKELDLSQISAISSTQDIKVRVKITTFI